VTLTQIQIDAFTAIFNELDRSEYPTPQPGINWNGENYYIEVMWLVNGISAHCYIYSNGTGGWLALDENIEEMHDSQWDDAFVPNEIHELLAVMGKGVKVPLPHHTAEEYVARMQAELLNIQ
jgi:hypothetical protein